jgi:hypothetical protein
MFITIWHLNEIITAFRPSGPWFKPPRPILFQVFVLSLAYIVSLLIVLVLLGILRVLFCSLFWMEPGLSTTGLLVQILFMFKNAELVGLTKTCQPGTK